MAQSLEELDSCVEFPERSKFFSSLSNDTISQEDYDESLMKYQKFNFQNLREYMELYCLLDTFLLAEVFQLYRNKTLDFFGIDPCEYLSLPGLSYDCFLRQTMVKLDHIYDGNFFWLFISRPI